MPTASALSLIIDITNPGKAGIIQSFQNRLISESLLLIRNDTENVSLRFVQPSAGTSRPWDDVDYSTALTILGLGEFDVVPSSGSNTFQFGPKTTGNTNSNTTVNVTGSTSGIVNGMKVAGEGIPTGTTITISGSTVTLSNAASSSLTGIPLYFYNETSAVPAGATAAIVSTAVNSLASVIAAGGVTISQPEPGAYLAVLISPGVTPGYFNGNPIGLNPASSIVVSEVVLGAVGIASQQLIEIFVNAYALQDSWSQFPSASAVVASVASGVSHSPTGNTSQGTNTITSVSSITGIAAGMAVTGPGIPANTYVISAVSSTVTISQNATTTGTGGTFIFATPSVQSITLTPGAYDGSISLTTPLITTQAVPITISGISAVSVQSALNSNGANYTVSGNSGGPFTVTDPTGNNTPIAVNVSNMIVPVGLLGTLNLSTYAMLQKFIASGLSEVSLELECQVTPFGGGQSTPLQLTVLVNKNVLNLAKLIPAPSVSYYTASQILAIVAALSSTGTTISIASAGSQNDGLALYNKQRITPVNVTAFSGTAAIRVLAANAVAGCLQTYIVAFPSSSTGVVLDIIDDAGSTTLAAVPGTSSASTAVVDLYFNGTNWILLRWA